MQQAQRPRWSALLYDRRSSRRVVGCLLAHARLHSLLSFETFWQKALSGSERLLVVQWKMLKSSSMLLMCTRLVPGWASPAWWWLLPNWCKTNVEVTKSSQSAAMWKQLTEETPMSNLRCGKKMKHHYSSVLIYQLFMVSNGYFSDILWWPELLEQMQEHPKSTKVVFKGQVHHFQPSITGRSIHQYILRAKQPQIS